MSYEEHYEDAQDIFYVEQSSQTENESQTDVEDVTYKKIKQIGPVVEHSNDHFLVRIINIDKLAQFVSIWAKVVQDENGVVCNRKRNKGKINEIYNAIINNTLASSIISVSEFIAVDKLSTRLICWDGQHRYWALRKYYKTLNQDYDGHIYLMIYRNDTRRQMVTRFKNINMGSSAQDTYSTIKIKTIVDNITNYVEKKFPSLKMYSANPRKPNYNIDNVNVDMVKMFEEIGPQYHTNDIITNSIKFIDIINDEFKVYYESYFTKRVMDQWYIKARQSNCFLFCGSNFVEELKKKITE